MGCGRKKNTSIRRWMKGSGADSAPPPTIYNFFSSILIAKNSSVIRPMAINDMRVDLQEAGGQSPPPFDSLD